MKHYFTTLLFICACATNVYGEDKNNFQGNGLPPSWDGFYAGISEQASIYKASKNDFTTMEILTDYEDHNSFSGLAVGGFAGLNQTLGNFLYGIEAGLEGASINDFRKIGTKKIEYTSSIDAEATARLRAGYVAGDFLIFATGGLAVAHVNTAYQSGKKHREGSILQPGWTVGAGIEYKTNSHWSTRLEYSFTDYGFRETDRSANPTWMDYKHLTEQSVKIGFSYQF
jgi:outer membrane immunogenic protein